MRHSYLLRHYQILFSKTYSCFTHLSRSILVRDGFHSEEAFVEFRDFFPDFLWLLRDVMLRIPNGATPTAYLKERVLTASGSKPPTAADNVAIAIHTFFPSIECWMLPPPSDDPDVMEDIENKENELSPYFKRKLAKLIHYIRQTIKAKTGLSSDQQVDGKMLASLMDHLVEAVNDPDTIPNLDNTWQHVITKKANEIIQAMVAEYEEDLQTILSPLLPLDEEYQDEFGKEHKNLPTLMGVHRSVLESKIVKLDKTLSGLVPHGTTIGKRSAHNMREEFCDKFIYQVVQCESERVHHTFSEQKVYVTGGILFKFTQKNKKRSHEYCMQLFRELYKPIDKQLSSWNPLYTFEHLQDDLCEAREKYFDKAVGPAKWDIYHRECEQFAHQRRAQLRNLQGFNHTILETMRKENEARTVNAKLHSDMQQMQTQIDNQRKREEERYQRRIEEVEEAKRRFRREEEQKRVALQNRYKELVRARMDEAARAQQRKIQEMKRIYVRREEQLHRERREAERRREGVTASWAQGTSTVNLSKI